jgi:calcineurin-like phosphoesterase family protein
MGRTIVIGDIHGCFDELRSLLSEVAFQPGDRVIAVGDLVVKGEKNREILDLFIDERHFSSVIGNHDLALVRFWRGEITSLKEAQHRTYVELEFDGNRYFSYLDSLPTMIDIGTHLVVHAGVRPAIPLSEQSIDDLTELRTLGADRTSRSGIPWYDIYDGHKIVLFGHWPATEPRRGKHAIGLDTGCVYGYRLTAYIVETGEFASVPAKRPYDLPKVALVPPQPQ